MLRVRAGTCMIDPELAPTLDRADPLAGRERQVLRCGARARPAS